MNNSAVIPSEKLEGDFYDWYERHAAKTAESAAGTYDLIFIGDSITHLFAGHPGMDNRGDEVWQEYYGKRKTMNLGFGWDRTQNVLWRLRNGEFAGQTPKLAILNIGTNNTSETANARRNTPAEICEGMAEICRNIWTASPDTHILLMGVFPRDDRNSERRQTIREINRLYREFAENRKGRITFLEIGDRFLDDKEEIIPALLPDKCHPSTAGYRIWAESIEPLVSRFCGSIGCAGNTLAGGA